MQLEFHQLDRRWEHLRVRHPGRQRRLLASLAEAGQQTPIVVVATADQSGRYLVIDGYKRIAALQQLGRDTVDAVLWPMSEAEALLLDRSLRLSEHETALEQGWLLQEMEQRYGYSLDELARRFDRSVSWVSRRLALVELLPEKVQQQVRDGAIPAHVAMKFLVPVARVSLDCCEQMAAAFAQQHCNTRQAGQLYAAWRDGSPKIRARILEQPELFLKTQRPADSKPVLSPAEELLRDLEMLAAIAQRARRRLAGAAPEMESAQWEEARRQVERARYQLGSLAERIEKEQVQNVNSSSTHRDSGTERPAGEQARDCTGAERLAAERAQSPARELHKSAGATPGRESRTPPPTDPGAAHGLQGELGSSP